MQRKLDSVKNITGKELLSALDSGELSVLEALGAADLRDEMKQAGRICRYFADAICASNNDGILRTRAINMLRPIVPLKQTKNLPYYGGAIVIGFNHPSLGEIFRLILVAFKAYYDKEFLLPVNIPWYEKLVPIIPQLRRMGITIVPMITPSTEAKLNARYEGNEQRLSEIHHVKVVFERNYMRAAKSVAERNGVIVVAPSATRQATVFGDKIHPTMTLLAHIILKNKNTKAMFLPVVVLEPKNNNRKFNSLKFYGIRPCKPFYTEEVKAISKNGRDFDYAFLKRIDDVYSKLQYMRKKH